MGVNKVIYDGETLVDLTGDSVSEASLVRGYTAHNAAGERITGTADYAEVEHTHTPSEVGLGNVPNVSTNNQTPTYTAASSLTALTSGEKLSVAFGKLAKAVSDLISHIGNKSNPHGVTAAQAGAVPTSRTINSKALSANISLTASDVGARPSTWTPSASDVGAAPAEHTHNYAGSSSAGGAATSANTVAVTATTPTSATTYYPLYASGTSGNQTVRANPDLYYYDAGSWAYLNIGSTNQVGGLTLHHSGGKYANLATASLTGNRDITIPDVSGTIITTGNLPTPSAIGAAPTASPTLTGTPKAPTAAAGTNTTQIATTAFVQAAVSAASGDIDCGTF